MFLFLWKIKFHISPPSCYSCFCSLYLTFLSALVFFTYFLRLIFSLSLIVLLFSIPTFGAKNFSIFLLRVKATRKAFHITCRYRQLPLQGNLLFLLTIRTKVLPLFSVERRYSLLMYINIPRPIPRCVRMNVPTKETF